MTAKSMALRVLGGLSASLLMMTTAPQAGAATIVTMTNHMQFSPATVTVHAGATVAWKNISQLVHTVTDVPRLAIHAADAALPAGAKPFNSKYVAPGHSYRHTFTVPGTYRYFCVPHEAAGMLGVVKVLPR